MPIIVLAVAFRVYECVGTYLIINSYKQIANMHIVKGG